jgi:hypothetical protein
MGGLLAFRQLLRYGLDNAIDIDDRYAHELDKSYRERVGKAHRYRFKCETGKF